MYSARGPTVSDTALYETDILAWSEQQAAALRELAGRHDLPNALDLAHVVEEIEDVGISQLNAVKSLIRLVFAHAIKCWADPAAPSVGHWLSEIDNWQNDLLDRYATSMKRRIDLDVVWRRAVQQAIGQLKAENAQDAVAKVRLAMTNQECPIDLEELMTLAADPVALVARLAPSD